MKPKKPLENEGLKAIMEAYSKAEQRLSGGKKRKIKRHAS